MKSLLNRTPIKVLAIVALFSAIGHLVADKQLTSLYNQSKFPVPYFVGQTSFDAEKIKAWYGEMINQGTLEIYIQTQNFDFVFILTVIAMGFSIWGLVLRLFPQNTFFRRNILSLSLFLPLAGLFDILENLTSYIMLANPLGFADWLAYIYSGFAVLKFGAWSIALLLLVVFILALPVVHFQVRRKKGLSHA